MNRFKQLALLWAFVAGLSLPVLSQEQFNYWDYGDGTCMLRGFTNKYSVVAIPSSINGLVVTVIGVDAFYYCVNLTSVIFPSSVTNIWDGTFLWIGSLTNITVDSSNLVYSSNAGALFDKSQTTLIQCPNGMTGSYAIPAGVTSIYNNAFNGCFTLTNVTIPSSVTSIGEHAFQNCRFTDITTPNSVTSIGYQAFSCNNSLTNVIISTSVTNLGDGAFGFCQNLTSVTIPNGVTSLGNSLFWTCSSLTSVTIPASVTSIGPVAFAHCAALVNVAIPNNVTSIWVSAFWDCTSLTSIYFHGNAPSLVGSQLFDYSPATLYYLPNTTNWGFSFGGLTSVLLNPQVQYDATFGVLTNCFGFTFTNAGSPTVVVATCTDLTSGVWIPVATNTLSSGSSYFSDSQWTNYPNRYYRFQMP